MSDFSCDYAIAYDVEASSCTLRFRCFDTPNAVTLHGCDMPDERAEKLLRDVRRTCLELHRLWSFSMPGSDVSRVNAAGVDEVAVDARTALLLQEMRRFHESEPVFDFTIGPASFLWKHAERVPSDDELAHAMAHVGAEKVRIEGCAIRKADPLVQIDVGGAAKGFAADMIAADLRDAGVKSACVDLGGNLYMLGCHPKGRPWRVAVRVPEGISARRPVLCVEDASVVTSGSYERFVEIDGVRYQHIIDASTGRPAQSDLVSATVVSGSSLQADLLATCALLVGSEGIGALASRHPGETFSAIRADGVVLEPRTEGFALEAGRGRRSS